MCKYAERCGDRGPVTIPGHDCVFDRLKEGYFRSFFAVCLWTLGYLTSQCVSVSIALP